MRAVRSRAETAPTWALMRSLSCIYLCIFVHERHSASSERKTGVRARLSSPLTPGLIGGGGGANYFADFLGIARTGLGRCDADEWFGIRVVFIFFWED